MKGLELAQQYYTAYGEAMLREQFPQVAPYVAAGLAGSGSECYGYDDETSRDHDFEPAFCIFIPDEDVIDSKTEFRLERAYAKLPSEFFGFKRSKENPVGGNRHGVIRIGDFYESKTGTRDGNLSISDWFTVPEHSLCEAVNGAVFVDNYGRFTEIRERLGYYPEDIRLKKLAGHLLLMGQSGQYNYQRCLARGETAAAQLAVTEFAKSTLDVIFLLNKTYMPYYKWSFRALRGLASLSELAGSLEYLISSGNSDSDAIKKEEIIESICAAIAEKLTSQGISGNAGSEMERQAYIVNDTIKDVKIRNMHILCAV